LDVDATLTRGDPGEFSVLVGEDVVAKRSFFGGVPGEKSILQNVRLKLGL
jgi:hypothetical protein